MSASARVAKHRQKQSKQGFGRIELRASEEDAQLLRQLASILSASGRTEAERAALRARIAFAAMDFKELLASAPLDDLDLDRLPNGNRPVRL